MSPRDWLTPILDAVDPRRRRAAVAGSRAHVELRLVPQEHFPAYRDAVVRRLRTLSDVQRVHVNGPLLRVVVDFGEASADVDRVSSGLADVERALGLEAHAFCRDGFEHPADGAALARVGIELSADGAAFCMALAGRLVGIGVRPLQIDVLALLTALRGSPYLRERIERVLGTEGSDLALTLAGAVAQGFAQTPVGPLVDIAYRLLFLAELTSRRASWQAREEDLFAGIDEHVPPGPGGGRPTPLPQGPIETYSDHAFYGSLGAFGVGVAATGSVAGATAPLVGGSPRPAHVARHAFVAWLGRALARRGILVMDRAALRTLDRVDTLVVDGRLAIGYELDAGEVWCADVGPADALARASQLLDLGAPLAERRAERWTLIAAETARTRLGRRFGARALRALDELRDRGMPSVALLRGQKVVAVIGLRARVRPEFEDLARWAGREQLALKVVATDGTPCDVLSADDIASDAAGAGLASAVADLQRAGKVVCLVTADARQSVIPADLVIGLRRPEGSPPWGCHVLCGPSLDDAQLLLMAIASAREVSSQGVAIAEAAAAIGLVLALGGLRWQTTPAVSRALDLASLVSMVNGIRLAARAAASSVPQHGVEQAWHAMDVELVLARLGTSEDGLAQAEAEARRTAPKPPVPGPLRYLGAGMEELANPLTPVLGAAASLSAAVGSVADALMVGGVAVFNAVTGAAQRVQAERAVEDLDRVQPRRVRVLRDGRERSCDASELVPGDVVRLEAGDVVPADCRILTAHGLEVDESNLTGESLPVAKDAAPSFATAIAERSSMLYRDTSIAAGRARGIVVAVGEDTEALRARRDHEAPPPSGVELRLRSLMRFTSPLALASGAVVAANGLLRGQPFADVVGSAVGLTVAAIPEGLPMIATLAQLASARRLSRRGALVQNARAIEALGRMDVVCLDKTGTLTEGKIRLTAVSDGAEAAERSDGGFAPPLREVLTVALRATPVPKPGRKLPHLTDRAVAAAADELGVGAEEAGAAAGWQPVAELPFEPGRAFHAVLGRVAGGYELCVKGAPEVVLARCSAWRRGGERIGLDAARRRALESEARRLARRGLRVLAVASRPSSTNGALDEGSVRELELAGFLGLSDPVRRTAGPAVTALRKAGVKLVMMTGDHPSTAEHIAVELGLTAEDGVLTGVEIDELADAELDARLRATIVIARLTPAHKVRIVRAYQRLGHVVGMTGDGANDAPAIRLAHVGIALGRGATQAARGAADIVITDDRIETLVDAVLEGRAMWSSVRDAIALLLGGNLGEMLFIVSSSLVSGASPLNARQLLLVNLLTDAAPALATALRPPRSTSPEQLLAEGPEASLGRPLERDVIWRALATAGGATSAWVAARLTAATQRRAGTVALASLVTSQLGQTLVVGGRSTAVLGASLGSFAATVGIIQTPGVSGLFGCTPLGPLAWSIVLGSSALATGASLVLPRALPGVADAVLDVALRRTPVARAASPSGVADEARDAERPPLDA